MSTVYATILTTLLAIPALAACDVEPATPRPIDVDLRDHGVSQVVRDGAEYRFLAPSGEEVGRANAHVDGAEVDMQIEFAGRSAAVAWDEAGPTLACGERAEISTPDALIAAAATDLETIEPCADALDVATRVLEAEGAAAPWSVSDEVASVRQFD